MNEAQQLVAKEKTVVLDAGPAIMSVEEAAQQFRSLQKFIKEQMVEDSDYGLIPGAKKNSCWKPGAVKLLTFHRLGCLLTPTENNPSYKDIQKACEDGRWGFVEYEFEAQIVDKTTGRLVGKVRASANSYEDSFRYRWAFESQVPQGVNKEDLPIRKTSTGDYMYRIENDNLANQLNNLKQRAQKRAMVQGALLTTPSSAYFEPGDEDEPESHKATALITEKQRGLVFARFKNGEKAGLTEAAFREFLTKQGCPTGSTKEIPASKMDAVLEFLGQYQKT